MGDFLGANFSKSKAKREDAKHDKAVSAYNKSADTRAKNYFEKNKDKFVPKKRTTSDGYMPKRTITLKSGEEITAGKKYREKKEKPLKSWGDEKPRVPQSNKNRKYGSGPSKGDKGSMGYN